MDIRQGSLFQCGMHLLNMEDFPIEHTKYKNRLQKIYVQLLLVREKIPFETNKFQGSSQH